MNKDDKKHYPGNMLPDIGDILFLMLLQEFLFRLPYFIFGDGSTGWHLATGHYILEHHTIPRNDFISYTFNGHPWIAYEWLTDTLMAIMEQWGGLNAVAVFFTSIIALTFLLLYERCRNTGCHFLVSVALTVIGGIASSIHFLARPHIFSMLGVLLFSTSLSLFSQGRITARRLLCLLCPSMLLWANLHPGFLYGFLLVVIYLACEAVTILTLAHSPRRKQSSSQATWLLIALLLTFAASLVNPYGFDLYTYIAHYLKGTKILSYTAEYNSPVFHGGSQSICLELVFASFIIGLYLSSNRLRLPQLVSFLVFGAMSLTSERNVPLFIVISLPMISELIGSTRNCPDTNQEKAIRAPWCQILITKWNDIGSSFDKTEGQCKKHLLPIVSVLILLISAHYGGTLLGLPLLKSGFSQSLMPSKTLAYIKEHHLPVKEGFNYDNWGGYIFYKLGIPVFIDDRADFYGERFYFQYGTVCTLSPGWQAVLNNNNISWVLFQKNSSLSERLKDSTHWKLACEDEASCLFTRR